MKILKKNTLEDGSTMQLEDWSEDYSFMPYGRTIAIYQKSKASIDGQFSPKLNKSYRFQFDFNNKEDAEKAYNELLSGMKDPIDYKNYISNRDLAICL